MKTFIPLENNPEVMTPLAVELGLSPTLAFHDVYSLTDASLLTLIPRPAYALLVTLPLTPTWHAMRITEDASTAPYPGGGPGEPVIWFPQTITHACGLIALLHSVLNGPAAAHITPGSELDRLRQAAIPLRSGERAKLLEESNVLEKAHYEAGRRGDTEAPDAEGADRLGNHYVAFVRGGDGHLWELEGNRRGPIDRGLLGEGEDVLSEKALEMGIGRYVKMEEEAGGKVLRFSCLALAQNQG